MKTERNSWENKVRNPLSSGFNLTTGSFTYRVGHEYYKGEYGLKGYKPFKDSEEKQMIEAYNLDEVIAFMLHATYFESNFSSDGKEQNSEFAGGSIKHSLQ
jgi:hypothetical protein